MKIVCGLSSLPQCCMAFHTKQSTSEMPVPLKEKSLQKFKVGETPPNYESMLTWHRSIWAKQPLCLHWCTAAEYCCENTYSKMSIKKTTGLRCPSPMYLLQLEQRWQLCEGLIGNCSSFVWISIGSNGILRLRLAWNPKAVEGMDCQGNFFWPLGSGEFLIHYVKT